MFGEKPGEMQGKNLSREGLSQESLSFQQSVKQVLILQSVTSLVILLVITLLSVVLGMLNNSSSILNLPLLNKLMAGLYGSALALTGTILSARAVKRGFRSTGSTEHPVSQSAMVSIYSGLLNKLVIVGGGIAFGLIVFKLDPIHVVLSFIVVQTVSVCSMKNVEKKLEPKSDISAGMSE